MLALMLRKWALLADAWQTLRKGYYTKRVQFGGADD